MLRFEGLKNSGCDREFDRGTVSDGSGENSCDREYDAKTVSDCSGKWARDFLHVQQK